MFRNMIRLQKVPRRTCVLQLLGSGIFHSCLLSLYDVWYSLTLVSFLKIHFHYFKLHGYVHISLCGDVRPSTVALRGY